MATSTTNASKSVERKEKRSSSSSMRPGKFLEGSMNDKLSQKPPSLYTKDEQAMEEYAKLQANSHSGIEMDVDIPYDAGIETHKPSGVFRFGKAIANAFRPFTAWQGMFKEKEKERSTSPEKNILEERQARAAEAYAELKRSGYKGTKAYQEVQEASAIKRENIENHKAPFRDSGIDMDADKTSAEWTPNDQLIGLHEALLVPPPPPKCGSASPFSDASSGRKSSLQLRKPSLQGLKKVASQIHLSPVKKSSETPPVPSIEVKYAPESTILSPQASSGLRREPSKKDIARQYKLSKKVSDLENKLGTARRELEVSMSNAPPVPDLPSHVTRKPFKPGLLPSLPSERNMTPLEDTSAPPAQRVDHKQLGETLPGLPPRRSSARLASSSNIPTPTNQAEDARALKAGMPTTDIPRPKTSHGIKTQTPAGVHKRLPRVPSNTPNDSPSTYAEKVPSFQMDGKAFPSSNASQAKPAASKITDHTSVAHTNHSPRAFLGRSAAASPVGTRSKISKRGISPPPPSLASAKKAKRESRDTSTPTQGVESSASAFAIVGSSESTLPTKTKRGISPPPPSLASTKKVRIAIDATATPIRGADGTSINSPADTIGPLISISPQKLNGDPIKKAVLMQGKALHELQKEDFEWDEDVF